MRKTRSYQKYQERKHKVSGMKVKGIDPAKEKHQVTVLDEDGIQMGTSFSINVSNKGFNEDLWKKLRKILVATPRNQKQIQHRWYSFKVSI